MSTPIPAGFAPVDSKSPFMEVNGPIYAAIDEPTLHLGFRVEQRHCNPNGSLHGGMLATLADFAMGRALGRSRDTLQPLVTVNLNLDYIGTTAAGAWVEIFVQLNKVSGGVVFATCEIRDGDQLLLTASGVFKFIAAR
jgi:uncharacterized protein (TIGR00369 family)